MAQQFLLTADGWHINPTRIMADRRFTSAISPRREVVGKSRPKVARSHAGHQMAENSITEIVAFCSEFPSILKQAFKRERQRICSMRYTIFAPTAALRTMWIPAAGAFCSSGHRRKMFPRHK